MGERGIEKKEVSGEGRVNVVYSTTLRNEGITEMDQ